MLRSDLLPDVISAAGHQLSRHSGILQGIYSIWYSHQTRYRFETQSKRPRNARPPPSARLATPHISVSSMFKKRMNSRCFPVCRQRASVPAFTGLGSTSQPPVGPSATARRWFAVEMRRSERRHLPPRSHGIFSVGRSELETRPDRRQLTLSPVAGRTERISHAKASLACRGFRPPRLSERSALLAEQIQTV